MNHYLALLRGINVGGKNIIKMSELKASLEADGLKHVSTFIQSGNVFFCSPSVQLTDLAQSIEASILKHYNLQVPVVVYSQKEWAEVIANAPDWWEKDSGWKYNLLALFGSLNATEVISSIGILKNDIEHVEPGNRVIYQGMSKELFGVTTTGKLAGTAVYQKMTIRNANTAAKLLGLFHDC